MILSHHSDMTETVHHADTGHAHVLPFYSARTLDALHTLVTNLDRGLAVYIRDDHAFGTIGTRGTRPFDGSPGLIIHLSVRLGDDVAAEFVPRQLVHNMEHTSATEAEIKALLIASLETAGLIPAGSRWDDPRWRFF